MEKIVYSDFKQILWLNNDFVPTYFSTVEAASEATGVSLLDIAVAMSSSGKTNFGYFIKRSHKIAQFDYIAQIDTSTEEIVGIYHGLHNAVHNTGITSIKKCLDEKTQSAGGYYWKHIKLKGLYKAKFAEINAALKKTVLYYDDILDIALHYDTIADASSNTGLNENEIKDAIRYNLKTRIGFFTRCNTRRATMPVLQIDIKSMSVIHLYNSVYEARMKTHINNIANCAKGILKTAGGYYWQFINMEKNETR